jgi:ubiquinone/menaquinone biosynthesis C-methylase UbiE
MGADVVGVDIALEPLRLGRQWGAAHRFVVGSGEALPFDSGSFDRVVARVSLPYMRVDVALREMARVLKPRGDLWLALHPASMAWREFFSAQGMQRLARLYVLVNGTLMHFTGRHLNLRGHSETFQTDRSITRALGRAGFENSRVERRRHYIVTATRQG